MVNDGLDIACGLMLRHQLIMAVPANLQTLQLVNWCRLMLRKGHQLRLNKSTYIILVAVSDCLCSVHVYATQCGYTQQ
jgi:hypothetical protein